MKILVIIPPRFAGCGFYRQYQPYNHLAKNYDVHVTFASQMIDNKGNPLKMDFDVVVWHKAYFNINDVRMVKAFGIPTVVDFDDHWVVNREHTMYREYTAQGTATKLHKLLKEVDYVTATTDTLADEIFEHNENVEVLPNAIDAEYEGWQVGRKNEKDFVFGYVGGPCHTRDVALLRGVPEATRAHFRLFGYNGTDIYNHYASILSAGGNFSNFKGADIWTFPQFYNMMDVSIVPLEGNKFNSMKSELKLLEAGAFSKAVIVSNVEPYRGLIRHGHNCLAANSKADWVNYVKTLNKNHNIARDLGAQLKEDTKQYDISIVNKNRYNFLNHVHEKHNKDRSERHNSMVNVEQCSL